MVTKNDHTASSPIPHVDDGPDPYHGSSTPPRMTTSNSATPTHSVSSRISSPTGPMSMSRRRAPPAWPRDRERTARESHHSIATPTALRVPATPRWSPGAHRSYQPISPAPLTAPYTPYRPYPSSAPLLSANRFADQPGFSPQRPTYRLVGAPQEWVAKGLNKNAAAVWNHPESADCRVCEWNRDENVTTNVFERQTNEGIMLSCSRRFSPCFLCRKDASYSTYVLKITITTRISAIDITVDSARQFRCDGRDRGP